MRLLSHRCLGAVVALGLAAAVLPAAAGERGSAAAGSGSLWELPTSGFTGASEHRDGTFVHTDHVFDDKGADVSGAAGGDFSYPAAEEPYMRNAADLVEVRLRAERDALVLGARLNTVLDRSVPVVSIGITDPAAASSDAQPWPGSGVRAAGVRWVVTLQDAQATVTDLQSGAATSWAAALENDTASPRRSLENTLTTRLPLEALGLSTAPQRLRLHAVAGVRSADGWYRPSEAAPAAYDLAFVRDEQWANWQQNVQADLLAGGDITPAAAEVDLTVRDSAVPVPTGAHTRIYRPSIEQQTGEGIAPNDTPLVTGPAEVAAPLGDVYLGLFLPYAVRVPPSYAQLPKPVPAFLTLHGSGESHQSHLFSHWVDGRITVPAISVAPLGRGGQLYYQGISGLDALEALADAKRAYAIDEDRVYLTGFSMGGIGTFTLGTQRPDLFAAAIAMSGPGSGWRDFLWPAPAEPVMGPSRDVVQGYRLGSFGRELLDNALNLPFRVYQGAQDTIALATFAEGDVPRWDELGYDFQYSLFLNRRHELVAPWVDALYHRVLHGCTAPGTPAGCERDLAVGSGIVRDRDPARVVYKSVPFHSQPEIGLVFDGAYWVSGMQVREVTGNESYGRIDATSSALAAELRAPAREIGPELRRYEPTGDDFRLQARIWDRAPQAATPNRVTATLENLAAVTLDMARMQVDVGAPITLQASGDGRTDITLTGPWRRGTQVAVSRDGQHVQTLVATAGSLVLPSELDGEHTYVLTPVTGKRGG